MDRKSKKDGGKRWLLWLLLVLILAGVFIWLIVRNNGTSLNIQDLSISSSSKNSISLDVEAEGNDLSYYYSLDGVNYTKVDGPSFTISGLSENTTYTVYVKVPKKLTQTTIFKNVHGSRFVKSVAMGIFTQII